MSVYAGFSRERVLKVLRDLSAEIAAAREAKDFDLVEDLEVERYEFKTEHSYALWQEES